jgi:hypothetical protein
MKQTTVGWNRPGESRILNAEEQTIGFRNSKRSGMQIEYWNGKRGMAEDDLSKARRDCPADPRLMVQEYEFAVPNGKRFSAYAHIIISIISCHGRLKSKHPSTAE